jgi:hypothetical protein
MKTWSRLSTISSGRTDVPVSNGSPIAPIRTGFVAKPDDSPRASAGRVALSAYARFPGRHPAGASNVWIQTLEKVRPRQWTSLFLPTRGRGGNAYPVRSRTHTGQHSLGNHLYIESKCCLLQQTTIRTACNRARKSKQLASLWCGVLESVWSPDAKKSPRGVHRRPNPRALSLLFVVRMPVSD